MSRPNSYYYCNLADVRASIMDDETPAVDDTLLLRYIADTSRAITQMTNRVFVPFADIRNHRREDANHLYALELREDLLSAGTISSPTLGTLATTDYDLMPLDSTPSWRVELTSSGGKSWTFSNRSEKVQIVGTWGYHEDYSNAFPATDTLQAAVTSSQGSVLMDDDSAFSTGDYIRINDEIMYISGTAAGTLTVERGALFTQATAHSGSDSIGLYEITPDIRLATERVVIWLYRNRDTVRSAFRFVTGEIQTTTDLSDEFDMFMKYERVRMDAL